jgi:hypothetical protein
MLHLMKCTLNLATMIAVMLVATAAFAEPSIIPQPVEMKASQGTFTIHARTRVVASGEAVGEAQKLINVLAPALGYQLTLINAVGSERDAIKLSLKRDLKDKHGDEGYRLTVLPQMFEVAAA